MLLLQEKHLYNAKNLLVKRKTMILLRINFIAEIILFCLNFQLKLS